LLGQGHQQRLAGPVEHLLDVDQPGAAEGLPGVVVQRPRQRAGAGAQHQRARAVGIQQLTGDGGVGGVGGDRGERLAKLGLQLLEPGAVAGDPDDVGAGLGERGGGGAAEASAGAGDQRGGSCELLR
jgi:hypothetical protein